MLGRLEAIVDLHRTADELIAAWALHAIYAHVRAANAHCVLRRPSARGVVLGGDQAVPRVERRGHRRTEINVTEPEHQIARAKHDVFDALQIRQPVDALNELDVARSPGRVLAHDLRVFFDREPSLWII